MASYNPYRTDPNLMQGFSNLTRALLGSAQDDASLASARASDARANLYTTQARGEEIDNARNKAYNDRVKAALGNSPLVNLLGSLMGFDNPMIEQEVTVDGRPPYHTNPYVNPQFEEVPTYDQDAYSGLVGALSFGQGGTADQTSKAAMNLREMGQLNQARQILLNELAAGGSPENIATILMGNTPGKYTQSPIAGNEIANALAGEIYTADRTLEGDKFETEMKFGKDGSEERIAEINAKTEKAWQNYKADKVAESESEKTQSMYGEDGYYDRKAKLDDDFKRWEHENRTIQMSVEAGKKIVVDPETGRRLKITPNKDGLYVLDGGKDATKVMVKVGKEDVYLSKEHAKELGIEKNAAGLYVIPGAGFESSASSSKGDKSDLKGMLESKEKFMKTFITEVNTKNSGLKEQLSSTALGGMMLLAEESMKDNVESGAMSAEEAYREFVTKPIMQGVMLFEKEAPWYKLKWGEDKAFPKYWFNHFVEGLVQSGAKTDVVTKAIREDLTKSFGYSSEDADQMMILIEEKANALKGVN